MIKSSLSDQCREIILGSLLGDGSLRIHKPYKNARFSFKHSYHQKEYFFWKVNQLEEISSNKFYWVQKNDGFGNKKLRYQSAALEELTELYKLTHEKGKLRVKRKWLNRLTPLSLAVWWLDDGSIIANGRKGVFCTDPLPLEEQKILAQYLAKRWHLKVKIGKMKTRIKGKTYEYFRLWIRSSEELKKFLRIILPFVKAESMLSKVILLYKDSQLQQRWISELINSTGFSVNTIEKYVAEKKSRWKNFRE